MLLLHRKHLSERLPGIACWTQNRRFRKDLSATAAGEDLATEIGAAIRAACKEACLTQQQLGELSGLSDRTIRDIETGTGGPGLRVDLAVVDVLGLRLAIAR